MRSLIHTVWGSDITYIPMAKGFCYLVAIMDWEAVAYWHAAQQYNGQSFCKEALEEALLRFGTPEIFNTDQGSPVYIGCIYRVLSAHGIKSAWMVKALDG